jgi:hypothetical protein
MKKRTLIMVYIGIIVVTIILGLLLSSMLIEAFSSFEFPFEIPPEYMPVIGMIITVKTIIGVMNLGLLFLMLGIYIDLYRKIKTNFTAGLLLLIAVLLLNTLTSNPLIFLRWGFPPVGPGFGFIIPDLFTTVALTVLFYLSLE